MNQTTVLDAHALIWFLEGSTRLTARGQQRLLDRTARLLLPAIALAEACWIAAKGRTMVTVDEIRAAVTRDPRLSVVPLDRELVLVAMSLPGSLEMHDRLIAATTAREHVADPTTVLMTVDTEITSAAIVPTFW